MKRILSVILFTAICLTSALLLVSCVGKSGGSSGTTYEDMYSLYSSEGLLCVKRNNKWGYIDKEGTEKITCKYYYASPFINGVALVQEKADGTYYFIKPDGSKLFEDEFADAELFDSAGRALVKKSSGGKTQLIDKSGKTLFTANRLYTGDNGLYLYRDDSDLYGVVDKNGEIVLEAAYDDLDFIELYSISSSGEWSFAYSDDRLQAEREVANGTKCSLIDLKGKELYTTNGFFEDEAVNNVLFIEEEDEDDDTDYLILLDLSGKEIKTLENADPGSYSSKGVLIERWSGNDGKDDYCQMIDWKGELIKDYKDCEYNLYGFTSWDGDGIKVRDKETKKYGVMDPKTGVLIVPCNYSYLSSLDENGIMIAKKDDEYKAIDKTGKTVFTATDCETLGQLGGSYYLASYKVNSKTQYKVLNKEGVVVKNFGTDYSYFSYFADGYFVGVNYNDGVCAIYNSKFELVTSDYQTVRAVASYYYDK